MTANMATIHPRNRSVYSNPEKGLSDQALLARLERHRGTERAVQRRIVLDLAEVERRRLYLPRGYGSLFEFCTEHLGYSRSAAGRRIGAARCIARFPRIARLFRRGECEITALSAIAGIITRDNCAEIASWLGGRSLREVEAFVVGRHPERTVQDRVRQIFVMSTAPSGGRGTEAAPRANLPPEETDKNYSRSTPSAGSKMAQPAGNKEDENKGVRGGAAEFPRSDEGARPDRGARLAAGTWPADGARPDAAPRERIVVERKFKIQFAVEPEFMEKLAKIRSLLSTRHPKGIGLENLFDILMNEYLEHHDPEKRIKKISRRGNTMRAKNNPSADESNTSGSPGNQKERSRKPARCRTERTRHIPKEIRDKIFIRDGGRCTFVSKDGKRCGSTWNLQVDHIIPYAKGGDNSPDNLRLLCERHNKLMAEKEYGIDHIKKFARRE